MISQDALQVLGTVHHQDTVADVATRLSKPLADVEAIVDSLDDQGLLQQDDTTVSPSQSPATVSYRDLTMKYHYIDFHEFLTPTNIRLLFYLNTPRTLGELTQLSGCTHAEVKAELKPLCHALHISCSDETYSRNPIGECLVHFARELVFHTHRESIKQTVPRCTVLWADPDTCLLKTTLEVDSPHYVETGPRRLADYGVRLFCTNQRFYYHQSEQHPTLTIGDVISHLLAESVDTRYVTYALLALANTNVDREIVISKSKQYDQEEVVQNMFKYLNKRGSFEPENFPRWGRFKEQASLYDIEL